MRLRAMCRLLDRRVSPIVSDHIARLEQMTVRRREDRRSWRIADANRDFVRNRGGLTVGYREPSGVLSRRLIRVRRIRLRRRAAVPERPRVGQGAVPLDRMILRWRKRQAEVPARIPDCRSLPRSAADCQTM